MPDIKVGDRAIYTDENGDARVCLVLDVQTTCVVWCLGEEERRTVAAVELVPVPQE